MKKFEFLNELSERLADIPHREARRVLDYYEEAIDDRIEDGVSEEEAVLAMGSADDIARDVLGEGTADGPAEEPAAKTMAETVMDEETAKKPGGFFSIEFNSQAKREADADEAKGGADGPNELVVSTFASEDIRAIVLKEISGDVEIASSPDDRLRVESEEARGLSCTADADGTLRIERKRVRKNGRFLGISFDFDYTPTGDVRLLVPRGFGGPLTLSTVSGDISVDAVLTAGPVTIQTVSGDLDCGALTCGALTVKTTSGDAELNGVAAESLDLVTVSGDVSAAGCTVSGRVSTISTNGDLELEIGSVIADGHFETVSGDLAVSLGGNEDCYAIRIKDGTASPEVVYGATRGNPLVLRTVSGDVELNFMK